MRAIEIGVFTVVDTGLSSVVTDNWLVQIPERLEMIVNSLTALSSFPALELAQSVYNML